MLGSKLTTCLTALALCVGLTGCDKNQNEGTEGTKKLELTADVKAGQEVFNTQCVACHTVGQGDRVGPDLKGVTERRENEWLKSWIADPVEMGKTDPIGQELLKKYKGIQMPPVKLTSTEVDQVLSYLAYATQNPEKKKEEKFEALAGADFEKAKKIYFDRCAGCHGTLRAGATGPNIQPKRTRKLGTSTITATLTNGLPGGMPAWGRMGILDKDQVALMARYVQMDPPEPPTLPMEKVKASWNLKKPVEGRPTKPETKRNWENFFGVVLRDAGQVAIIDGDTKEKVAIIDTGFAVHILRSSSSGRYFYAVGRDGKITLIDLWPETPEVVAQVQGCYDARSVEGSKFKGYEDKLIIEGCYWPPQYVVYDGLTLEPKKVQGVLTETYDTKEKLEEVRVAAIVASHYEPLWVANLKESGHVALIDYSKDDFPITAKIPTERFLHDGGWDHTGRYFIVAANMRNHMVVVDVKEKKMVTKFETGLKPHPGRGANWQDPEFGWVNATSHIGEGKLAVYGADPAGSAKNAWKVVRSVKLPSTGSLFVKTHEKSQWVWLDFPLSNKEAETRKICVFSKKEGKIHKCWSPFDHGRAVHFEYNQAGDEVWVSGWDKKGELVIYDDATLKEKKRIKEDWLVTPTGKFNVHNTAHDIY